MTLTGQQRKLVLANIQAKSSAETEEVFELRCSQFARQHKLFFSTMRLINFKNVKTQKTGYDEYV